MKILFNGLLNQAWASAASYIKKNTPETCVWGELAWTEVIHQYQFPCETQVLHFTQGCRFYSNVLQTADNGDASCLRHVRRQSRQCAGFVCALCEHPAASQRQIKKGLTNGGMGMNVSVPSENAEDAKALCLATSNKRKMKDDWMIESLVLKFCGLFTLTHS